MSFVESLAVYLERMLRPNHKFLMAGDFNLPSVDWKQLSISGSHDAESAHIPLDSMFFHYVKQVVLHPTHVADLTNRFLILYASKACQKILLLS